MARKTQKINFETSIAALEELVEKMEGGEFSLEESLQQFERGISLARACQQALREAEQKVQQLTKDGNGGETLTSFEPADNE
jgi:exodeoxyribonuclease VII small subunit